MSAAPPRRRLQAQDRRDQILRTARDLFIERGFEGVGMADLADALGTSRPTIYTYFPSTIAILEELLRQRLDALPERLARHLHTEEPVSFAALFEAILQEEDLLRLLNSGGGPLFRSRRQEFLGALEARLDLRHLPGIKGETLRRHPLLLPLLLDLLTNAAYNKLNRHDVDLAELTALLDVFAQSGVRAVAELP
ncbi:TetR/AcrR family transcriptional regulator [Deinococcus yavapaiensis]|uniref:TetR family transcriptional regulator n=1 Tax=Deinococcus yavapaiensis KR-236 TaxID=694435 RepID=A0A318S6Q5_9DEIO|nr:TetR/AcrR family transcriptional regulator [Deinococcus yavapaiensis]PYE52729.1 TetR family transcriptional regulator [Deinococcus yavapaiensis KR-236]